MSYFNAILFIFLSLNSIYISIISNNTFKNSENLKLISSKYDIVIENIKFDNNNQDQQNTITNNYITANKEITINDQILIIPTINTISSTEDYQFKEYFSRSSKEMLIGRLLIERFIGKDSFFNDFLNTFPGPQEINDYYHYSDYHKLELNKRSINKHSFENRKDNYESLITKIPSSDIPSHLLNLELYNWANSIIDCYGIIAEKEYKSEVKKLYKYSHYISQSDNVFFKNNVSNAIEVDNNYSYNSNSLKYIALKNKEILLIPGLNLFDNYKFSSLSGNNLSSSLYAYKDYIYLNSDRYIEENMQVFNNIQFQKNLVLFESCGKINQGFFNEEVYIKFNNNDWDLFQYDICKAIDCGNNLDSYNNLDSSNKKTQKKILNPTLVLKNIFNNKLFVLCQIDQIKFSNESTNYEYFNKSKENISLIAKLLNINKRINNHNYIKALGKCNNFLSNYLKNINKTYIEDDVKHYINEIKDNDNMSITIFKYAISQKKILNNQLHIYNNRIIKEFYNDIYSDLKKKYI